MADKLRCAPPDALKGAREPWSKRVFLLRRGSRVLLAARDRLPLSSLARLDRDLLGVRRGDWKAMLENDGELTVFNTGSDREEKENLAAGETESARSLVTLMREHFAGCGVSLPEARGAEKPCGIAP